MASIKDCGLDTRPDWDDYFLKIVDAVSDRCSCTRGKTGAIFVKDNRILVTGYAGAPPGLDHCFEYGDDLEERVKIVTKDQLYKILMKNYNKLKIFDLNKTHRTDLVLDNDFIKDITFSECNDDECIKTIKSFKYKNIEYTLNIENDRYEAIKKVHCVTTNHAELNCILQAAKNGISVEGCTVYVGMTPCYNCSMALISIGVKRIVCAKRYHAGANSEYILKKVGISIIHKDEEVVEYNKPDINPERILKLYKDDGADKT